MPIDVTDGTLTVWDDRRHRLLGLALIVVGIVIAWYSIQNANQRQPAGLGVAFGLCCAAGGLAFLWPAQTRLAFVASAQEVRETRVGWLGLGTRVLPFEQVVSIGTDTYKDPRTGAAWDVSTVLRLKDGRRWILPGADCVKAVSDHTGFPVEDLTFWHVEPVEPAG